MYKCISMHVYLLDAKVYISYGAGFFPLPPSCLTASSFSEMPASPCLCKKGPLPEPSLLVSPLPSCNILNSEMCLCYIVFFPVPSACSLWLDPNLSKHRPHTLAHSFRNGPLSLWTHINRELWGQPSTSLYFVISLSLITWDQCNHNLPGHPVKTSWEISHIMGSNSFWEWPPANSRCKHHPGVVFGETLETYMMVRDGRLKSHRRHPVFGATCYFYFPVQVFTKLEELPGAQGEEVKSNVLNRWSLK